MARDKFFAIVKFMEKIGLGYLTASEFVSRRSRTLTDDPNARLNEEHEIGQYLAKLDPSYRDAIDSLAKTRDEPLCKEIDTVVTIIATQEGSRIGHTLNSYLNQDLDPKFFEIIIYDDHSSTISRDNTSEEVDKFKKANPNISVIYAYRVRQDDEFATVGNARKYGFDVALARIDARGKSNHETILISNDADTVELDKHYLSAIRHEFQVNTAADALVTPSTVPLSAMRKPNVYAALALWDAIDDFVAKQEPRNLEGRSSAYRASIYAAVGGYNPKGKLAGDLETGFLIADARGWDPRSVIQFAKTGLLTDPRRVLESVASRIPINEMYYKFVSSPEVRHANNAQLLDMIPDSLDWELFEEDADSFLAGGDTGMYKWRGERFKTDFKQAMGKIGAQFVTKGNRLYLTNIDQLIDNYKHDFGDTPQIIHSTRRPYDRDRIKKIKLFFSTVSDSAIACRKKLADQIAQDLELANQRNDLKQIRHLQGQYERFAGHLYKQHSRLSS